MTIVYSVMKILVVGTISNASEKFQRDFEAIKTALASFDEINFFFVESDSSDSTISILNENKSRDIHFDYVSLGTLRNNIPERIERIRFCRNRYVDEIRESFSKNPWEYVIVADLDGMNGAISETTILNTLNSTINWDGCFANQQFGYYDLFALRAPGWLEENCFSHLNRLKISKPFKPKFNSKLMNFLEAFHHFDKLRVEAIYCKMCRIKRSDSWIPVNSAFGGFGIYRAELFLLYNYNFLHLENDVYSEHIDFHAKCVEGGARLYINPSLINSHLNVYNLNRIKLVRFAREFKKFLQASD